MAAGTLVQTSRNQQGLALLVTVILIVLAFAAYSLSGISINQVNVDNSRKTTIALKKAKVALLSFAVVRSELVSPMVLSAQPGMYGYLPCPADNNGDGNSVGSCDNAGENTLGWFPWKSLMLSPIKDGNGDCLLYAVSSTYKFNPASNMLNQDSYGMFEVRNETGVPASGATPQEDRVVAIIFSSGKALPGQNRVNDPGSECNNDVNNFDEYLDSFEIVPGDAIDNSDVDTTTANQIDAFIHATTNSESSATPHNDRFVTILRDEVKDAIFNHSGFVRKMENLTQALAMCLASYANLPDNISRRLPWPAETNLGGADYALDTSYQDNAPTTIPVDHGYSGRFPFNIVDSNSAIDPTLTLLITDDVFNMAGCNALVLTGSGAGVTVDLVTLTSEYLKLWNNWKDHFFYVLSKQYEPSNTAEQACDGINCITVNAMEYAGVVIFSGKRRDGVVRNDKSVVAEYLEDGKATAFADEASNKFGNESYNYTVPQTEDINDIMYCINNKALGNDLDVSECP